jgi:DNA-binding MarR family transcriptional regulator
MSKPKARSTLYRLIEAGQLTHKALLVPLIERGLEPGDDAVLFILHNQLGATEADLAGELGIADDALRTRIERLIERDLIARKAIGPDLGPGLALTELGKKDRKALAKTLERFVELLRL